MKHKPPTPAISKRFRISPIAGLPRAELDTSKASLSALNATVDADRARRSGRQVQLECAAIAAPSAHRSDRGAPGEGNLVRANSAALVVINRIMPIQVAFSIPEARLPELKRFLGPWRAAGARHAAQL